MSSHLSDSPIRVGFCITELRVGGAERCLTELATGLKRERFVPIVYCLRPRPVPPQDELAGRLESRGIVVRYLGAQSACSAPFVFARLVRCLRQDKPDVLQSFLFHANVLGRFAARCAGVRGVVSGIRVAERDRPWRLALDRATSRLVDRYVCVSQSVADFSQHAGGLNHEKLMVIPNGIDVEALAQAIVRDNLPGVPKGRRFLCCVGRLEAQKRVDWLLRLTPRVLAELDDHDLLIVGQGPQRAYLEKLAAELGVQWRVHFLGWRNDVPAILAASDALLLSSAWEGMPNVVLEAMACGKPVIATDVEGVKELLGEASEPQIAAQEDTETFVQKILEIARNPTIAARLGDVNRRRAGQHFSIAAMVRQYEALYHELLGHRPV